MDGRESFRGSAHGSPRIAEEIYSPEEWQAIGGFDGWLADKADNDFPEIREEHLI